MNDTFEIFDTFETDSIVRYVINGRITVIKFTCIINQRRPTMSRTMHRENCEKDEKLTTWHVALQTVHGALYSVH